MCLARWDSWGGVRPDYLGSDTRCAFRDGQPFSDDNWCCATIGALRELVEDIGRPGIHVGYYCDHTQSVAQLDVYEVEWPEDGSDNAPGFVLWMTWYKSRGATEGLWLMGDLDVPKRPTEAQVLAVLKHYGADP